jgi:hypothetical protein
VKADGGNILAVFARDLEESFSLLGSNFLSIYD